MLYLQRKNLIPAKNLKAHLQLKIIQKLRSNLLRKNRQIQLTSQSTLNNQQASQPHQLNKVFWWKSNNSQNSSAPQVCRSSVWNYLRSQPSQTSSTVPQRSWKGKRTSMTLKSQRSQVMTSHRQTLFRTAKSTVTRMSLWCTSTMLSSTPLIVWQSTKWTRVLPKCTRLPQRKQTTRPK